MLSSLSFCVIIGAAIYEHTALWPAAFSTPPRSLTVFQGPYALNAAMFWMPIHPVTFLLLVVALILSWKTERKKFVMITVAGYAAILLATFTFFVPELIDLTGTPYSETSDHSLQVRGNRWIVLSIVRAGVLIGLAITLLTGLTKHGGTRAKQMMCDNGDPARMSEGG